MKTVATIGVKLENIPRDSSNVKLKVTSERQLISFVVLSVLCG
ncbi:MAG: hypothetical protein Q7J16_03080 [Candidatus Cloacimonadales bacterium]|nr:hypothetical protein [Candidatus Cloacimonadales bacterium]